jgi:GT2 family glycosyltransferase
VSEQPAPTASVVILNWNGLRFLDACLEAVSAQDLEGGLEIILVDGGSGDGSVEAVRSRFPEVRVVEAGRNLGYAAGNNLGMGLARAEWIVLLNNDTRVRPGWLRALVEAGSSHPQVAAVTAKLLFADRPKVIQSAGSLLLSEGAGGDRGFGEPDRGQYDRPQEVFAANGASMLLRKGALDDAGLLDETFFMYYEDTDLCWRLRLRGWRILYEPKAVVEHFHAGSSREGSPFFLFHADRNRVFMLLKNAPWRLLARSLASAGSRAAGRGPALRSRRGARHLLWVAASLVWHLPEMLVKRARIRRRRRVADSEIRRWLYPRERWLSQKRSA